jgi:hypothetical protein
MDGRGNTRIDDLVNCTKARALRHQLREIWLLPKEDIFANSGPNWLLHILDQVGAGTRCKKKLRAWHLRNDMIFGDGKASVEASAIFLHNYMSSLLGLCNLNGSSSKGKNLVDVRGGTPHYRKTSCCRRPSCMLTAFYRDRQAVGIQV